MRIYGISDIYELYPETKESGLPSLEFRRVRGDLFETYKLLQEIYDPVSTKDLLNINPNSKTRDN